MVLERNKMHMWKCKLQQRLLLNDCDDFNPRTELFEEGQGGWLPTSLGSSEFALQNSIIHS